MPHNAARESAGATNRVRWISCARCDTRWTGLTACHCGACHRIFTGLRGFHIHRWGGRCNDPANMLDRHGRPRLVPIHRPHWIGLGKRPVRDQ